MVDNESAQGRLSDGEFEIYIDFVKNQGDPSRVFHAMGELIDALALFDSALTGIITEHPVTEIVLTEVSGGSIRAFLRNFLKSVPDDAIKDGEWKKALGHFLVVGKHSLIKWLEENPTITEKEQLLDIKDQLEKAAEATGVLHFPAYRPVDLQQLSTVITKIDTSVNHLDPKDRVQYESNLGTATLPHAQHQHEETILEFLTHDVRTATGARIVKVKKPDFLGKSQWELKYRERAFHASINDADWLAKYQTGQVEVRPGDSLHVIVKEEVHLDYKQAIIKEAYSIERVIAVIPPTLVSQISLDIEGRSGPELG
jgi:hypothetical protein